jgi:hypothetical protein
MKSLLSINRFLLIESSENCFHDFFRNLLFVGMTNFLLYFSVQLNAQEIYFPKQEKQLYSLPVNWSPIPENEKISTLKMLVETTESTYKKIKSISVFFNVKIIEGIDKNFALSINIPNEMISSNLVHKTHFTLECHSDSKAKHTLRIRKEKMNSFENNGTELVLENMGSYNLSSILSSDSHLYSHENEILPTIPELPGFPETERKRVAWREPPEGVSKRSLTEMIDPYEYFDFVNWGNVKHFFEALSGNFGEKTKNAAMKDILLFEATDENGDKWYRMYYQISTGKGNDESNIFWSQKAGFSPVCYLNTNSSHLPIHLVQVRWEKENNIFFPVESHVVTYHENEVLSYRRESVIENLKINQPIDSKQFSYSALGLSDGDILVDRVKQQVFTIKNDKPVYLAKFYEKYQTPQERNFNWVRMYIMLLGFALIALGIYLKIRRRRIENNKK